MLLQRNIAGFWIVRYCGEIHFTATQDVRLAIEYAFYMKLVDEAKRLTVHND